MFKPGQSGNAAGRPKGSRNKLETDFLDKLYADWQVGGEGVIAKVRESDPVAYLKIVAQLLPKESKVDLSVRAIESVSDEQARLMAEALIDSARASPGVREEEPDRVHDSVSPGLPSRKAASQDK